MSSPESVRGGFEALPTSVQAVSLAAQVPRLVEELAEYHGYRTLWLDRRGSLCHGEPEDEFEGSGLVYVATMLRPGPDDLAGALKVFAARRRFHVEAWTTPGVLGLGPEPALVSA